MVGLSWIARTVQDAAGDSLSSKTPLNEERG